MRSAGFPIKLGFILHSSLVPMKGSNFSLLLESKFGAQRWAKKAYFLLKGKIDII